MPRKIQIDVAVTSGAIDECVVWVNHNLVADHGPPASWSGKIPTSAIPVTVEVAGIADAAYTLTIQVDGETVVTSNRKLDRGLDVYKQSL